MKSRLLSNVLHTSEMNTEYGKSRNVEYSHGTAQTSEHCAHAMGPNSKRGFVSLFVSENHFVIN